jgi:hypothetical protein
MKELFQNSNQIFPEKEKGEKEIKVELDPGEPNRPREENQPAAHLLQTRNGTLRWPSSLADRWAPPASRLQSPAVPLADDRFQ